MPQTKQRNHTFDLLCGLCIVRMIMLHCVSMCSLRHEFWFGKLMGWTFFFICFFFFKAGYFNRGIDTAVNSFGDYLVDRSRRLLIPYVMWGVIGSVVYFGFIFAFPDCFTSNSRHLHWEHVYLVSHFWGNPPVWFLFSFWATYVLMYWFRHRWFFWIMPLLPCMSYTLYRMGNPLWMSLNNVPLGLFMFVLGHLWHHLQLNLSKAKFLTLSLILLCCFIAGNKLIYGSIDMSLNRWNYNPFGAMLDIPLALTGISGVLLCLPQWRIPFITFVGEHSMVYFVMHYPLIYLYKFTLGVNHIHIAHSWWHCTIMMALILTLCTLCVRYVESIPWLSGRIKTTS